MALRNAFDLIATEGTLGNILSALSGLAKEHPSSDGASELVSGNKVRFRKDFIDASLADWDVVTGSGMSVSAGAGNLVVTTGTTINSTTTVTSKQTFTAPFKAAFGFKISQKIVNQEFYVEIIACDDTTGVVDETTVGAWRIAGSDITTATVARYEVRNGGAARLQSANVTSLPTQTADSIFEITLESDEIWFHARNMDSAVGRVSSNSRQSVAPNPNRKYKLRYRIVNGAVAPASTTTFTSAFVSGVDYTEFNVEVTGGQGSTNVGQAVPVAVTQTVASTMTSTAISALATVVGTTPVKVASAATTNATLVKATAGRLYGYELSNLTASWKFVKMFNLTTAPTVGTSVPVFQIAIPPNATIIHEMTVPMTFATGISYAITGGVADLDATATAVNDVVGALIYL